MKANIFVTKSLELATTLSLWFPVEVDKTEDPKRSLFKFENSEKLQNTIKAYWKDELKISPKRFWDNLKFLKNQIYQNY